MGKQIKPIGKNVAVEVTRRNNEKVRGKVVSTEDKVNGRWVTVNTAGPREPQKLITARESAVRRI